MVEVHQPNSEPDVNEVRPLPQARGGCPAGTSGAGGVPAVIALFMGVLACGWALGGCGGLVPSWDEGWERVLRAPQGVASTGPTCGLYWPSLWPPLAQPTASDHLGGCRTKGCTQPFPGFRGDAQCLFLAVG